MSTLRLLLRRTCGCRRLYHRGGERSSSSSTVCASRCLKVAVLGAGGKTGRCLSLCLKQSPLIDELAVYDARPVRGLILELSHMDTRCRTIVEDDDDCGTGTRGLVKALKGANIVAITLDGKSIVDEATELEKIVPVVLGCCPKALVSLTSRWVNSLLPMLFELYKRCGVFDCGRLFGCLNLFSTRANSQAAQTLGIAPEFVNVPVIGGGTQRTCVPLFSQTRPCADFTPEEANRLTMAMKSADELVAEAYNNDDESSALCSGFAAARFCISLCKALRDEGNVLECAYTRSCLLPELKYIGAPLELGPVGVQRHLGLPPLTKYECQALRDVVPEIKRAIAIGESLALGQQSSTEVCPVPARCSAAAALQPYQPDVTL